MSARRPPFRRRNALAVHELHYGPNMTPMVDVVMVILIFFMASASVMGPEWFLRVALPRRPAAGASPHDQPARVFLSPTRNDGELRIAWRFQPGTTGVRDPVAGPAAGDLDWLRAALSGAAEQIPPDSLVVLVQPDAALPYADAVAILELCRELGIARAALVTPDAAGQAPREAPADPEAKT